MIEDYFTYVWGVRPVVFLQGCMPFCCGFTLLSLSVAALQNSNLQSKIAKWKAFHMVWIKFVMWFKKQKKRFWIWGEGEPVTTQPVCRIRRLSRRSKVSHQSARTALTNKQREKKSEVNKTTLWSRDCQHLCPTFNLPTVPIVADESQPACAPSCYGLVLEQTLWFLADYVATALLIKRPTQTHWYTKTSKPIHCFEFQRILQLFHFLTQITSHSHVML